MRKHRFIRTVIADALFVVGLAAIVVAIAAAGHWAVAIGVAGVEATGTGALLMLGEGGDALDP